MNEEQEEYTASQAVVDMLSPESETPSEQIANALKNAGENDLTSHIARLRRELNDRQLIARRNYQMYENTTRELNATTSLRLRDQATAQKLLEEAGDGLTPIELDNAEQWSPWWHAIVTAGIFAGHAHEAHRLCLNAEGFGSVPEDAWETVSRELRNENGTFPDPVSQVEAVQKGHRRYTDTVRVMLHPADTRLSAGWRAIWLMAKQSEFCDAWDRMAETMGIPQPELPTRSGTVSMSGTWSATVPVSMVPYGEEPIEHVDMQDIINALDTYDITIDSVDDEYLENDDN